MQKREVSHTYLLIEARLGAGGLDSLVTDGRSRGLSWARITADIHRRTDVLVSSQTLRNWYPDGRRAPRARQSA